MSDVIQPNDKRLYIFGKNGCLVRSIVDAKTGKSHAPSILADQDYFPDVMDACFGLRLQGHQLAVVSNEGGCAFGILTEEEADLMAKAAAAYIGTEVYRICPFHPKGKISQYTREHPNRLPQPGMLSEIMHQLGFLPSETIFVDDWETSRQAANMIGAGFEWSHQFFKRVDPFADRLHAALDWKE